MFRLGIECLQVVSTSFFPPGPTLCCADPVGLAAPGRPYAKDVPSLSCGTASFCSSSMVPCGESTRRIARASNEARIRPLVSGP